MNIDPKIQAAVILSVQEATQGEHLAHRLLAWMDDVFCGNESIDSRETWLRRVELLYDGVSVSQELPEPEEDDAGCR